jgi:hypothetical protein
MLGDAPALPRVAPEVPHLAIEHQEAAEGDAAVNQAHGQVDHGHALELHALEDEHGEIGKQRQECEHDGVDQRPQKACRAGRQQLGQQHDGDMRIAARDHGGADERHPHQTVAGDFLGPGEAVVEDVAREELQEHDEG